MLKTGHAGRIDVNTLIALCAVVSTLGILCAYYARRGPIERAQKRVGLGSAVMRTLRTYWSIFLGAFVSVACLAGAFTLYAIAPSGSRATSRSSLPCGTELTPDTDLMAADTHCWDRFFTEKRGTVGQKLSPTAMEFSALCAVRKSAITIISRALMHRECMAGRQPPCCQWRANSCSRAPCYEAWPSVDFSGYWQRDKSPSNVAA
jgi:hypothetical protein